MLDIDMASARSLLRHQNRACTRGLPRPCRLTSAARWLYIDSDTVVQPRVDRVRAYLARTACAQACELLNGVQAAFACCACRTVTHQRDPHGLGPKRPCVRACSTRASHQAG